MSDLPGPATDTEPDERRATPSSASKLISASAVMAAGTLTSRVLGFGRLMLLVLLFGNGTRQADMFTYANTVPNSMYILLAGGVLNTVLVPQIVRAIKGDKDGGEAYTNRIMTAGLIILAAITVALTLAAPLIIRLYTPSAWHTPERAPQFDSMVMLAYYCLPQIFFYGVHVLAGQVLNARDRFGPMMWAPIANNVISIVVLVLYLVVFGHGDKLSAFTRGQELTLGLGSTLGIAAQAAVLIPFLRASGYHFQPRFDFKNTGLGKTFHLAKWTLGFVIITQAALVVVNRLAGSATAAGEGAGLTVYYNAYAVWILPHSLITVSLATAMLPAASRLAAAGDLAGVRDEVMRSMRLAVTALLPAAVAMIALGLPIAQLAFGFGQGAADAHLVGWALMALALGLVPFTLEYMCLRAYYSLEDTRSTFFLQLAISGIHVTLALTVVFLLDRASLVATGLALAYAGAYTAGVLISFRVLSRKLPGLAGRELVVHCIRLLVAVTPAGGVAYGVSLLFARWSDARVVQVLALVVAGVGAMGVFLLLARLLQISEVKEIVGTVLRRNRRTVATGPGNAVASDNPPGDADDPGSPGDSTVLVPRASPTIMSAPIAAPSTPDSEGPIENAESMVSQPGATHTPNVDTPNDRQASQPGGPGGPQDDTSTTVVSRVAAVIPAGTVLANRYRLEELLADSEPTVTWRAFDQMLSRSVLVHLLPPQDPGAPELLAAARQAAVATDSRFLRVLDAVHSDDPDLGSYIVCEFATGQSLEMILSHGPLSGLEAAWVIREVADALSGVHTFGLYHRRINPDTVIITPTGNIKIVGLLIEAALRPNRTSPVHGATTPELVDVMDLGRLFYAALVSRWPGGPGFGMPDAPVVGRRWMTPRQVRAGVSPALDQVCDQILGEPPRHRLPQITTANDLVNALTKVLGAADASGDLERRLRQPIPRVGATSAPAPVSSLLDQRTEQMARVDGPRNRPSAAEAPPPPPRSASSAESQADGGQHPPAPTPALPEHTSDAVAESAQATLIRQPAPPGAGSGRSRTRSQQPNRPPVNEQTVTATKAGTKRRRWVAVIVLLSVLLVAAGIVSALVLNNRLSTNRTTAQSPAATQKPTPVVGPVKIQSGRDFDPQGDDKTENPGEVKLAFDGNAKTRWRTLKYRGSAKLGGLKRGVGIVADLGQPQQVGSVKLTLSGVGTSVEVRVPKEDPARTSTPPMTSDSRWDKVGDQSKAGTTATLSLKQPVTTRFVLVYLTSLPKEGNGYRGGIYEVEVFS